MSSLYDEFLSQDRSDDLSVDFLILHFRIIYAKELLQCRSDFESGYQEYICLQSLLTVSEISLLDSIVLTLESNLSELRDSYVRLLVVYKILCEKTGVVPDADLCDVSFLNKEF